MGGETRMHPYKAKEKKKHLKTKEELLAENEPPVAPEGRTVIAQFISSDDGSSTGPPLNLPANVTPEQLKLLLNDLLQNEDPLPYSFFVSDSEITNDLNTDIIEGKKCSTEETITILYQPQAVFRIRNVTRCTSSLTGHSEAILSVCFSPDGSQLATGSGDTTVRIWDLNTETPQFTLTGHKNWVQHVAWAPDSSMLASGGMDTSIRLWNPKTGKAIGTDLKGHTKPITSIVWEPYMRSANCNRFATGSMDGTVRVWDAVQRRTLFTLSQHTGPVMCVKWGGDGLIYTGSRDKTIKVWDSADGKLVRSLEGHAHWVNHLTLSTDYVLRSGPYDHTGKIFTSREEAHRVAIERYHQFKGPKPERLASGSDDHTLFLWEPSTTKKAIARMTGHQQLVNHLSFSPDGRMIASASFDKSVKLWDGVTGKFINTLRGHVGSVYQTTWSADSRIVLSGSKDSTLKCWDLKTHKIKMDLPGHLDEVFSVDWSPRGDRVASGGKDRILKIWRQ
ncbi:WD40-repeat-containing domain protein [Polychytrium aggregatum]|uniref:WD40-repeat-containing domain protein n=1 Tax=Polychytrium aggregatum TaxID=110093 RepID=UPI0022FF113C|nr:WD40-repeat-containing domain protein [Polychytrium aggregatum]KAI9207434.1 WD40-repeat-containing domain protein [Polychytrium aggregatum]